VLLLHGATSSSRTWWQVAPKLVRRGWHVSAVDLPGHGETPADSARTPRGIAERLSPLVTKRALDLLVGHSLGALVALELLDMVPHATRRLVLDEPPGLDTVEWEGASRYLESEQHLALRDSNAYAARMCAELPLWHPLDCAIAAEDIAAHDWVALCDTLGAVAAGRSHHLASTLDVPTLIMAAPDAPGQYVFGGDYGSSIRRDERARLVAGIPGAQLVVFGRGHVLHRDAPQEWSTFVDEFGHR
jgi:pimeloyl-ACP methyl ester carboxylesterase